MKPCVVYSSNELLSATNKNALPALQKSNVIYQFSCHCDSQYVGHTSQKLQNRIKQHVPKSIIFCPSFQKSLLLPVSAIQPLDFIFHKLLPVLNIMLTVRFLFLPKAILLFIYMLLKPLLSKLLTQPFADKEFVYSSKIVR